MVSPFSTDCSSAINDGMPPASKKSSMRRVPAGMMSTRSGKRDPIRSMSSRVSWTPTRPAIASRCRTALVDPPTAESTQIAFSKAFRVRIALGRKSSRTISTIRLPVRCASRLRRVSGAGIVALCGNVIPRASAIDAIVEAVPMGLQWPALLVIDDSVAMNSSTVISPARTASLIFHMSVADPSGLPLWRPVSIGPPVSMIVGKSTEAAPINMAGVVLSQPDKSTTPSKGLQRTDSSTSIAMRFRSNIAVG